MNLSEFCSWHTHLQQECCFWFLDTSWFQITLNIIYRLCFLLSWFYFTTYYFINLYSQIRIGNLKSTIYPACSIAHHFLFLQCYIPSVSQYVPFLRMLPSHDCTVTVKLFISSLSLLCNIPNYWLKFLKYIFRCML